MKQRLLITTIVFAFFYQILCRLAIAYEGTGYDFAGLVIKPKPGVKFVGASAGLEIYQPSVEDQQFSTSMIMVQTGNLNNFVQIQVGWTVNKDFFHDTLVRSFSHIKTARDGVISQCANHVCDFFKYTSNNYRLGTAFQDVSVMYGKQVVVPMSLDLEPGTGWWVSINNEKIGYWPTDAIYALNYGADSVFMGGMVFSNKPYSPPMGSGNRAWTRTLFDANCFMKNVALRQTSGDQTGITFQVKESRCYYAGRNGYVNDKDGYMFAFGGQGGSVLNCWA